MKKLLNKTEFYIFLVILVLGLIIQARSGQFFTGNNAVDLCTALVVPGMFSVGMFMIIVSGGIDVSFPAQAALASYIVVTSMNAAGAEGPLFMIFLYAGALGLVLGAFNALFIAKMNLLPLIVTLGTQSVYRGILQGALNAQQINDLPATMTDFGKTYLFAAESSTGTTSQMPASFLFYVVLLALAFFIMRYTMLGRGIYAVGGDENSAHRAGFKVVGIKSFVYIFSGIIAGIGGIVRACMMNMVHPTNLFGMEMTVIAGVVLGGTAVTGGTGTLTGTVLGMLLLTIVDNSLILLGIPSYWQSFVTGVLIIVGTAVSSMQVVRAQRRKAKSARTAAA